jgi:hypothetical protein
MCIYCGTRYYRKIYENHHGPIPKDQTGRLYEIHHTDGNHSNNEPSNLKAVTIQEHYDIHYSQGDYSACALIAIQRMNKHSEEISELVGKASRARVAAGTHNFLSGEIQRKTNATLLANGTHNFLNGELQRADALKRIENGTHHLLGGKIQRAEALKRLEKGSHNFIQPWSCEHCGKAGKGLHHYKKWHGDNCKVKKMEEKKS